MLHRWSLGKVHSVLSSTVTYHAVGLTVTKETWPTYPDLLNGTVPLDKIITLMVRHLERMRMAAKAREKQHIRTKYNVGIDTIWNVEFLQQY